MGEVAVPDKPRRPLGGRPIQEPLEEEDRPTKLERLPTLVARSAALGGFHHQGRATVSMPLASPLTTVTSWSTSTSVTNRVIRFRYPIPGASIRSGNMAPRASVGTVEVVPM